MRAAGRRLQVCGLRATDCGYAGFRPQIADMQAAGHRLRVCGAGGHRLQAAGMRAEGHRLQVMGPWLWAAGKVQAGG